MTMTMTMTKRARTLDQKANRGLRQTKKVQKFNVYRLPNQMNFFWSIFNAKHGFFLENMAKLQSLSSEQLVIMREQLPSVERTCRDFGYDRLPILEKKHETEVLKQLKQKEVRQMFNSFLINKKTWNEIKVDDEDFIDSFTGGDSQLPDLELREFFYFVRNYHQQFNESKKFLNTIKYLKRELTRLIDLKK